MERFILKKLLAWKNSPLPKAVDSERCASGG